MLSPGLLTTTGRRKSSIISLLVIYLASEQGSKGTVSFEENELARPRAREGGITQERKCRSAYNSIAYIHHIGGLRAVSYVRHYWLILYNGVQY